MNIAIVFAGGVGSRMGNRELPKQFIEIDNIPILIHTLNQFEVNPNIDAVILVMLDEWIEHTNRIIVEAGLNKVAKVVSGGETGQMSIFNGLATAKELYPSDSVVLIHDGVRPFITQQLINDNIKSVEQHGSAISSVAAIETFLITDENNKVVSIPNRERSIIAKAPQSFVLETVYNTHLQAQKDGLFNSIDSSTLMHKYGNDIQVVFTDHNNIKVTTPKDIELGTAIYFNIFKGGN